MQRKQEPEDYAALADEIWDAPGASTGTDYAALADEIWDATEPSVGEYLVESGKAFVKGAIQNVSEGLRGAGAIADAMRSLPLMGGTIGSGESVFTAAGDAVGGLAPDVNPIVENSVVGGLASGLGQVGGLMGIGALNPALAFETAFLGGASETDRQVAAEMTKEDGGAGLATLLTGGAIGTADMIPVGGVLARINRLMGGNLAVGALRLAELERLAKSGGALSKVGRVAETAALEAGTEGLQKVLTNALVNNATGEDLSNLRGVMPEAAQGGAIGAILATAVELATRRRRALMVLAAEREIPFATARSMYEADAEFAAAVDFAAENEDIMQQAPEGAEGTLLEGPGSDGYDLLPGEDGFASLVPDADIDQEAQASATAWGRLAAEGDTPQPPSFTQADLDENPYLGLAGVQATPEDPGGALSPDVGIEDVAGAYDTAAGGNPQTRRDWQAWRSLFDSVRKWSVEKLRERRNEILIAEDQALREQFPGKGEWFYEGWAQRRELARNPFDAAGDRAALEIRRAGIKPLNAAVPVEMLDAAIRLRERYPEGKSPSQEKAREAAGATWGSPEYRTQDQAAAATQPTPTAPEPAKPFKPSATVRAFQSTQARVPVAGQAGPQGQPVYPITGSRPSMPWGGTEMNVIGAKMPTALSDIGRALLDLGRALGPLTTARRNSSGNIMGSFDAGGVLDAGTNDIESLAHEVSHLIHRWALAGQRSGQQAAQNWNAELDTLPSAIQGEMRSLAYQGVTPGRELAEGFAELGRLWFLAPEQARAKAPNATRWFEGMIVGLPSEVRAQAQLAQSTAQDYRFQGDELRRVVRPPPGKVEEAEAALRGLPEAAARRIYDDTSVLRRLDPKLQTLWRSIRGTSAGILNNLMVGRPSDMNGNEIPNGINFESVMKGIGRGERGLFGEYVAARMTLALEGKGVDTGKLPAESRRLVDQLNQSHPHFAAALDGLQSWWAQINKVLADASPTYAAGLARIAAHDAAYGIDMYAPLHRWMTRTERGKAWASGRAANKNNISREREGSAADVKDPVDAFVNEARRRLEQAVYRNMIENVVAVYDATGGDQGTKTAYISEVTKDSAGPQVLDYGLEGSVDSMLAALASPEMQKDRIPVRITDRSGAPRFFLIDRRIAEMVAQVDPATLRNGLGMLMGLASLSRRGISTFQIVMNPTFQFFTNIILDTPMAYLVSSYFKPHELPTLVGYVARNILENVRAAFNLGQTPKWVQKYEALGLHSSSGWASERRIGKRTKSLSGGTTTAGRLWEGLAQFMSIPQRSVQLALMQKAAKRHAIDITRPITADEANILRAAARQPVDYNAGGDLSRRWSLVVPFLRPALESQRQLLDAARTNRVDFFSKVGVLAGLTTAARYLLADDEIEQSKTATDALRSLSIPTGTGEAINLRIPGEIAWMTMLPTIVAESIRAEGQSPMDFIKGAVANWLPPGFFSVPAVNLLAQQAMDKRDPLGSLFLEGDDAPIVPRALEGMDGIAQRTPATAPLAIGMATMADKVFSYLPESNPLRQKASSPVRWEAALRALIGGNGVAMTEAFNLVPFLRSDREPEAADYLSGVYRRGGETSWNDRYIRQLYEINYAAMQKKATLNGGYEDPMDKLRRTYLARTCAVMSTARFLATYEGDGATVAGRRELAAEMQALARKTIESLKQGKLPDHFFDLEARFKSRRTIYDLERGAFY